MLRRLILLTALTFGFVAAPMTSRPPCAWADTTDAGVTVDAGSGSATAPIPPPPVEPGSATAPAVAAPVVVVPTPPTITEPEPSTAYKLWKDGALVPAIIVSVFLALSFASKRFTWLQKGTQAAVVTALMTGCAVLVERAAAGTTPSLSMTLTALGAAVLLFMKPTPKQAPAPS